MGPLKVKPPSQNSLQEALEGAQRLQTLTEGGGRRLKSGTEEARVNGVRIIETETETDTETLETLRRRPPVPDGGPCESGPPSHEKHGCAPAQMPSNMKRAGAEPGFRQGGVPTFLGIRARHFDTKFEINRWTRLFPLF